LPFPELKRLWKHAEEASFWWFLLQLSMESTPYFRSPAFFLFLIFSVANLAILIAVTSLWASSDPMRLEAVVFLYGASATLLINMMFFKSEPQLTFSHGNIANSRLVNWAFPQFIAKWKAQGAAPQLISRLLSFHNLNSLRLVFMFCFS
jgi:hypothetical protein